MTFWEFRDKLGSVWWTHPEALDLAYGPGHAGRSGHCIQVVLASLRVVLQGRHLELVKKTGTRGGRGTLAKKANFMPTGAVKGSVSRKRPASR
jgi:hypothetical protein